jgi:hypothetical protein
MRSPHLENRRSAGNNLRIAAERLAKLVVIADRKSKGSGASLADFKNMNLSHLRPLVTPCSLGPDEPGLWEMFAKVLNDANHDTPNPPSNTELVDCHGQLKRLKADHTKGAPGLMTP